MTQYIDKDALVAEIERQQRRLCLLGQSNEVELRKNAALQNGVYFGILSFINTLEVKEVDLEREIDRELKTRWMGEYLNAEKFCESAKHFFELGLKVQKGE